MAKLPRYQQVANEYRAKIIADLSTCKSVTEIRCVLSVWESLLDSLIDMSALQRVVKDRVTGKDSGQRFTDIFDDDT